MDSRVLKRGLGLGLGLGLGFQHERGTIGIGSEGLEMPKGGDIKFGVKLKFNCERNEIWGFRRDLKFYATSTIRALSCYWLRRY